MHLTTETPSSQLNGPTDGVKLFFGLRIDMKKPKQVLSLLNKRTLIDISREFGFTGLSVLPKDEIINRLARKRFISLGDILSHLMMSDLKYLCDRLGLNIGGISKKVLIDRIVGEEAEILRNFPI